MNKVKFDFVEEKQHIETGLAGKRSWLRGKQAANKMIKKLRELPVENEDANHNINDDDLYFHGLTLPIFR